MPTRFPRFYLLIILLVALCLRVITVVSLNLAAESDYAGYQSMAQNFISGAGMTDGVNMAFLSAGYPLLILAPVFAITGNNILAAQLVNALLGTISVLLCYMVTRQAGAGRLGGLIAASLFALYIPSWVYAEYLAKENLMTPLMLAVIWCALKLMQKALFSTAMLCGVLLGLLSLVGNAALSIAGAVVLALFFVMEKPGHKIKCLFVIMMLAVITASPWIVRNYLVIGAPVVNSNSGFNLYIGNNPSADGLFVSVKDTPIGPEWETLRKEKGEMGASRVLGQLALEWIKEHPANALKLGVKKAILFWMPPVHEGKGEQSKSESLVRMAWLAQFLVLVIGAISGLFFKALRNRTTLIVWATVTGYTAIHMLFYVVFRYREPLMPFLCVLCALAIEQAWEKYDLKSFFRNRSPDAENYRMG
ncbi:glycosyltransferase family 39 protein [Noviherbaspirillum sp. 1P10PC]|uniref:ArnT family glycosyltransferase n=1 Tax=Noviherbaspirillum sp. 1P10PC TaxID=3132292 RepID=UPI0039A0AF3B